MKQKVFTQKSVQDINKGLDKQLILLNEENIDHWSNA